MTDTAYIMLLKCGTKADSKMLISLSIICYALNKYRALLKVFFNYC